MSDSIDGNSETKNIERTERIEPIFVNPRNAFRNKYASYLVFSGIFFFGIWLWYSNGTILVAKGFFDSNCPTYDYWILIFLLSVSTIWQWF